MPGTVLQSLVDKLPGHDCGLCDHPTCRAHARAILVLDTRLACPFLTSEERTAISDIHASYDGGSIERAPTLHDRDVVEIHPCTEDGMCTLETYLKFDLQDEDVVCDGHHLGTGQFDALDAVALCAAFDRNPIYSNARCSSEMGYAVIMHEGKRIHVFKSGKMIIRRADDRNDALETLHSIAGLLWPALICSCGNPLADCYGGGCTMCRTQVCPALIRTPLFLRDGNVRFQNTAHCAEGLECPIRLYQLSDHFQRDERYKKPLDLAIELWKTITAIAGRFSSGIEPELETMERILDQLQTEIKSLLVAASMKYDVSLTLALAGVYLGGSRLRSAFSSLAAAALPDDLVPLLEDGLELINASWPSFRTHATKGSAVEIQSYESYLDTVYGMIEQTVKKAGRRTDRCQNLAQLAKAVMNAYYFTRIPGKPIPTGVGADQS